jgi:hypothetical protein
MCVGFGAAALSLAGAKALWTSQKTTGHRLRLLMYAPDISMLEMHEIERMIAQAKTDGKAKRRREIAHGRTTTSASVLRHGLFVRASGRLTGAGIRYGQDARMSGCWPLAHASGRNMRLAAAVITTEELRYSVTALREKPGRRDRGGWAAPRFSRTKKWGATGAPVHVHPHTPLRVELAPALADPRAALEALGRRADELRAARDELLPGGAAAGWGKRAAERRRADRLWRGRLLAVEVALEEVERARAREEAALEAEAGASRCLSLELLDLSSTDSLIFARLRGCPAELKLGEATEWEETSQSAVDTKLERQCREHLENRIRNEGARLVATAGGGPVSVSHSETAVLATRTALYGVAVGSGVTVAGILRKGRRGGLEFYEDGAAETPCMISTAAHGLDAEWGLARARALQMLGAAGLVGLGCCACGVGLVRD